MRKKSLLKRIFTKRRMRKIKTSLICFKKKNLALVSGKMGISRGLAISVSVLILAAAVAGINWAKFSATKISTGNTLSAGTLELSIEKPGTWTGNVDNLKPGEEGRKTITVKNTGSIDGVLKVTKVEIKGNNENGCGDPEIENGDDPGNNDGELPEYLIITIGNTDDEDLFANGDLASLANGDTPLTGANVDLDANADTDIVVKYRVPEDTGNIIQSDNCDFTITFTLEQE